MTNKKKLTITICSITAAIAIAVIGLLLGKISKSHSKNSNLSVGFYNTDSEVQTSLENILTEICSENNIKFSFTNFTNENLNNLNKCDLVFAPSGFAQKKIVNLSDPNTKIPDEITKGMFSSAIQAIEKDKNKIKAIPIVFDNFEIDIETSEFIMSKMSQIATWKDIENFAKIQKDKIDYPICYAGDDATFTLDLLGALAEGFEGVNSYNKAVSILEECAKDFNTDKLIKNLFFTDDAPLYSSLEYLRKLKDKGYLNPGTRFFTEKTVELYVTNRITNVIFTTLSAHRKMNVNAIARYSTIYVPSKTNSNNRNFTATGTYAIPTKNNNITFTILEKLMTPENQGKISCSTGLSPVLANCITPDKQSDDARFWIAATNAPLAGLGHEVEFTDEQLNEILTKINSYIF